MTPAQTALRVLLDKQSKARSRLSEIAILPEGEITDEIRAEAEALHSATPDLELRIRSARAALDDEQKPDDTTDTDPADGEARERLRLRSKVRIGSYMEAAIRGGVVSGAEAEYNSALGIRESGFPLEILAPVETEDDIRRRATTDAEAGGVQATAWIDRVFADHLASRHVGVTFKSVAPGVQRVPLTTAGATVAQRGRSEATADAPWTVTTTDIDPHRAAVRAVFTREDQLRNPGLEDALRRELRMALAEGVDRAIFLGDSGANEDSADIIGLNTAAIGEVTLKQADKVKADKTLAAFAGMIDGKYSQGLDDLRIVASVGAGVLWLTTIHSTQTSNETVSQFLMHSGLSWRMRGEIETATSNGKFGAFVGLQRGITDAACAAVWDAGELIRDHYTRSAQGEVALTLNYFWGFKVPRTANFQRLKFVS